MKILYISCHQVLEYDEVKLFHELGFDVFSTGTYAYPHFRPGMIRPGLPELTHYPELERLASTIVSSGYAIPSELIEWADTIIFMHLPEAMEKNWEKLRHKRVIFRSIGQCVAHQERILARLVKEGLQIVRYSPMEQELPDFAGLNATIRFYKDPSEFRGYTGENPLVINFSQSILQRQSECHYQEINQIMSGFDAKIFGTGNENLGSMNGGQVSYEEMKRLMRESRAFIYGGTWPAPYTLSLIEAMMSGIPVVALGKKHAELDRGLSFYEVHDIIQNGVHGFVSNDVSYLKSQVEYLINHKETAIKIGEQGRQRAIELFGKETIKNQWESFLKG
ncbi:MAG TPA: hypothetical protein VD999_05725 [Vitreimonas sp.]|nr:hypothetical protein [Vitreimonas sp.]